MVLNLNFRPLGLTIVVSVMLSFLYRVVFVKNHLAKHELCNVVGIKLLDSKRDQGKKQLKERLEEFDVKSALRTGVWRKFWPFKKLV